jgi:hypothetical protein
VAEFIVETKYAPIFGINITKHPSPAEFSFSNGKLSFSEQKRVSLNTA